MKFMEMMCYKKNNNAKIIFNPDSIATDYMEMENNLANNN